MLDPSNYTLFRSKNFEWAHFEHLLACKNSSPELLSIRRKIKNFSFALIHFHHLVSSISLQRNVLRGSNFQLFAFKNYLPIPRRFLFNFFLLILTCSGEASSTWIIFKPAGAIPLLIFLIVFHVPPRFLFLHLSRLGNSGDSSFAIYSIIYLSISLTG